MLLISLSENNCYVEAFVPRIDVDDLRYFYNKYSAAEI